MTTGLNYSTHILSPGNLRFKDLEVRRAYASPMNLTGVLYIDGDLTCNGSGSGGNSFNGGSVEVKGNFNVLNSGCSGTTTIKTVGVNQSISSTSGAAMTNFEIASSGTVTASGTFTFGGNFSYTSGTVDMGTSTVYLNSGNSYTPTSFVPGPIVFYNFGMTRGYASPIYLSGALVIGGDLSCSSTGAGGSFEGGSINLKGNFVGTNLGCSLGSTPIQFSGNSAATVSLASGAYLPGGVITVNKGSGSLTLASNVTAAASGQSLTIQTGTVNLNSYNLSVNNILTISSGATLTVNGGSFTPNSGGNFINNGTLN